MPILAWKSPVSGIIHLAGYFRDQDPTPHYSPGGVGWFIDLNSTPQRTGQLAAGQFENGAPAQDFNVYVDVRDGDMIYFGIDPLENSDCDTTA